MFSAASEPLNTIVSEPPCPSTVSLPSPGFHWNVSSPAPRRTVSLPAPTVDEVVPGAADQHVVAVAAEEGRPRQGAVGLVQGEVVVAAHAVHEDLVRIGDGRHPPWIAIAPLFTRIVPPASRETTMVLSCSSPTIRSSPADGGKRGGHRRQDAAIQQFEAGQFDQPDASRRPPTARAIDVSTTEVALPHEHSPGWGRHGRSSTTRR